MEKGFLYFINSYNYGMLQGFSKIKVRRFKNSISFLEFLQNQGLIAGFVLLEMDRVEVFLIKDMSVNLRFLQGKRKKVQRLRGLRADHIAVITEKGFMTLDMARGLKISGVKVCGWI